MPDSFIRDSLAEMTLLSATGLVGTAVALLLITSEEGCSGEQRTIVKDNGQHNATATSHGLLHTTGTQFVLFGTTQAVVVIKVTTIL